MLSAAIIFLGFMFLMRCFAPPRYVQSDVHYKVGSSLKMPRGYK